MTAMNKKTDEYLQKARELTACLTLEEKIGMIHGAELFKTRGVPRLGIPPLVMSDGPMGVRQEFFPNQWKSAGNNDDYVTYLPCNSALAAAWNRDLSRQAGSVLGEEARGRKKDVILAPGINIKRSPLCGRNFEYFSEDPYLTRELAVPFIEGVQEWDVAACVKHFAANNQETERLQVNVEVDEQALRRIYLPAFEAAVKEAGSYTIMGAYNRLYGEHCCQSDFLLRGILREEWAYDGVVISDWGGVHDTKTAAESPLDIEMSVTYDFDEYYMADPLRKEILEGRIPESTVDEKVTRILLLMMRLHMLDGERKAGAYNTPEHRQAALDVARESVVLLKNSRGQLPLTAEPGSKILVIGENAVLHHADGGGSAEIKALYEISPLMGIKKLLGGNVQVDYLPGYCREEKQTEEEINWQEASLEHGGGSQAAWQKCRADDECAVGVPECGPDDERAGGVQNQLAEKLLKEKRKALRQKAVEMAPQYDQVIFIGGLTHDQDSEGNDRADMKLPCGQDELISGLFQVRPDMVVVMVGGSPIEMGSWVSQADSLIWSYYAGMEGGTALAEVLFGAVNPSGKLPESFYRTHMDCSAHCLGEFGTTEQVNYREGVYVGYRYLDAYGIEPQFCFGHGLSYTSFDYEEAKLVQDNGEVRVSCRITNTGSRSGAETVQAYQMCAQVSDTACVHSQAQKEGRPPVVRELKGFEKVFLAPGEMKEVQMKLADYQEGMTVALGSSSRDIRLMTEAE